jgi:PAS domain S-box-containing protein
VIKDATTVPEKVLIVEDTDEHYELLQRAFESLSGQYLLARAKNIQEAQHKIDTWRPSLVITDWKLPDGDGIALIRKDDAGSCLYPVIVMTSHGNESWAVAAMKLGALDYIVKSAETLNDMSRCVQRVLREWRNIQERTRIEEALRRSEEKYRIVADNTYDWEFWISPDDRFIYSSPSCEKITGYLVQEFETDPDLLYRLVHPDHADVFKEHRHSAKDLQRREEIEFRIICRDGSIKWMAHACQPVYDAAGGFIGTRGSNRDITQRKTAEEEKEKLISELWEALAKVKQLSGMLPICASCKKIKDDQGYWNQIDAYISEHSEAEFSHGLCPDCAKKLYPDYFEK